MSINFPTGMLFVDPRTNAKMALAQLSFSRSGTAIPAPVYQDANFTTPWIQPIIASASGNFPPVYMHPLLSVKVKVQIANSLGVVQRTVDPYFIPFGITSDSPNIQYASGIFEVKIPLPSGGGDTLTIANIPGSVALRLVGGGVVLGGSIQPAWAINNIVTGVQTASFASISNKPGPVSSTPAKWLPILSGGVTYFVPCFL